MFKCLLFLDAKDNKQTTTLPSGAYRKQGRQTARYFIIISHGMLQKQRSLGLTGLWGRGSNLLHWFSGKWHSCGGWRVSSSGTAYAKAQRLPRNWHNRGTERSSIIFRNIFSWFTCLSTYCTCFESKSNSPVTDHSEEECILTLAVWQQFPINLSISYHEFKYTVFCFVQQKYSVGKA